MTVWYYICCEIDKWHISVPVDKNVQNTEVSEQALIFKNLRLFVYLSNSEFKCFITKVFFIGYVFEPWLSTPNLLVSFSSSTAKYFFRFYVRTMQKAWLTSDTVLEDKCIWIKWELKNCNLS